MNVESIIERIDNFRLKNQSRDIKHEDVSVKEVKESAKEPDIKDIESTIEKLNISMENFNERISFSYHEVDDKIVIRVVDNETKEVVREIPSRDLIKLNEHIQEFIGMIFDESG